MPHIYRMPLILDIPAVTERQEAVETWLEYDEQQTLRVAPKPVGERGPDLSPSALGFLTVCSF